MPIDDPISAARALIAGDERERSPVIRLAKDFFEILNCFPPARALLERLPVGTVVNWLERREQENRQYLVDVLIDEVKRHESKLRDLEQKDGQHAAFIRDEYPGLVLDGLNKSERVRAKERIVRIGRILASAAEQGPARSADQTEEMMRIAMDLDDRDVFVLRELHAAQASLVTGGVIAREAVNEVWRDHPPRVPGMGENEIQSICAKLQSYGLVTRIERNNFKLGLDQIPHAVLQKGADFILYIQGIGS